MAGGLQKFIDDNTKGTLNKAMLGLSVVEIAKADNKLKALIKTIGSMLLFKPLLAVGLAGAFASIGKSIRSAVRDSGALEAALKRFNAIQVAQRKFGSVNGSRVFDFARIAGRDLGEVTEAVDKFKRAMQEGDSVNEAADGLREMGLASEATISHLTALQQSGANSTRIFNEFTRALRDNATQQRTVAGIAEANHVARDRAAAAAGSGFVGTELRNTQNETDAMNAMSPRIERVSGTWAKVFGGFGTAKSTLGKWAAENPVAGAIGEGVGHAFPFAMLAAQAWGVGALSKYAGKMAGSSLLTKGAAAGGAIGKAARFGRFGLRAVPYLGTGLMLAELGGAAYNYLNADEDEKRAREAEAKKAREEEAARRQQERQRFVRRAAAMRETAVARAELRGDRGNEVDLQNLGTFADHFERLRNEFGAEAAAKMAGTLTHADILQNASIGADSLARLGLGGETGGTDVSKQIRDLNRQMVDYLRMIDAKLGGGNGPAGGTPMSLDDNPI